MENNWEKLYKKWGRKKKKRKSRRKLILIPVLSLSIVLIVASFYLFILPTLVGKPFIPKPTYEENVTTEHINWVVNEMGAYKLQTSPVGEKPEIEVNIFDTGEFFTVIVEGNTPITYLGKATNPDIRLITKTVYVEELLEAPDLVEKTVDLYNEGKIKVEILKDELTLISKGYMALYNELGLSL